MRLVTVPRKPKHARSAVPMNRWLYSISCAWYGTMLRDRCATPTPHHKYKDLKGGCIGVRSRIAVYDKVMKLCTNGLPNVLCCRKHLPKISNKMQLNDVARALQSSRTRPFGEFFLLIQK
uniref:Uncharacterized protein n=1 Tax=Wuchereria bancrofti TaxID=6293 RepID=A0AAF5PQ31_WUCBA